MTNKTESRLYHKDVYMPAQVKNLPSVSLEFSEVWQHAHREMNSDKNGQINFRSSIQFNGSQVVEFEKAATFDKFVIRIQENRDCDSVWVVRIFKNGCVALVTVWLNARDDNHKTLDTSKYYNPKKRQ